MYSTSRLRSCHQHMSISELYEIGKRSRNPFAGINKEAARGGKKLVALIDDDADELREDSHFGADEGEKEGIIKRKHHRRSSTPQNKEGEDKVSNNGPKCLICRLNRSKYNCPACNIPYCSLTCYRSANHANCSQPFLQKTLQSELGSKEGGGMVDDRERKQMMDVLRRMNSLKEDVDSHDTSYDDDNDNDNDTDENNEEADEGLLEGNTVDLENASVEQLFSLLTAEERSRFKDAIEDRDPGQGRARYLYDKVMNQQGISEGSENIDSRPWWDQSTLKSDSLCKKDFVSSVEKLAKKNPMSKAAKIEYNILAVLLAYAYLVRHLDVCCLKDMLEEDDFKSMEKDAQANADADATTNEDDMPPLEPATDGDGVEKDELPRRNSNVDNTKDEKKALLDIVKNKVQQLMPFLSVSGDASRVVLESVEEVSIWVIGRLGDDATAKPAKTLSFLYKDVEAIIKQPKLVDMNSSSVDRLIFAFSDIVDHLSNPSQRKLVFYSAYWLHLAKREKEVIADLVKAEMQRLQAELDRGEDEERFQAANEASSQQNVVLSA